MIKEDLTDAITSKTTITRVKVKELLEATIEAIQQGLLQDEKISLLILIHYLK